MTNLTAVLDLPLAEDNDAGAKTVREYLELLLLGVWHEGEGFDGKRPFGNSCWESDLTEPLVEAGYAEDEGEGYDLITEAIKFMCGVED